MKRLIDYHLLNWKNSSHRKSLLIRGARQVGKTYAVRNLGKLFDDFAEFNLEKMQNELTPIFEASLDPQKIIKELSIISGKQIIPGRTLLFFDEIQAIPRAILALRYFYEELPTLHVIGAGSLLDFAIEQVGLPVGRVQSLYMYPVSFIEFLGAFGQQLLIQEIMNRDPHSILSDVVHNKLLSLVGEYLGLGGMPEVIQLWLEGKYVECFAVHQIIIDAYRQDFSKYAKKHQIRYLELLFKHIPNQLGKKFKFSELGEYRKRELSPALELLDTARVVHFIHRTAAQGIPLGAQQYLEDFKIILLDVALSQVMLGEKKGETSRETLGLWFLKAAHEFINKGTIIEAFVGQELIAYANPFYDEQLYYWHKDVKGSEAEVDYVVQQGEYIIPIEVKDGKGTTLRSMNAFLELHQHCPYGIRFSTQNYSMYEKIHSYPLYAIAPFALYNKDVINSLL